MSATTPVFDYIVVGGGTAGCVLASRLSHADHSVAIFEAGPENYSDEVMSPLNAPRLHGTALESNYTTTPQPNLANRQVPNFAGRLLSGSSAVNYGNWTRCHSADYDAWADLVGHERWNYANLLKYFRRVEHHHDSAADPEVYGLDGPMYTTAGIRHYPLRDPLAKALQESGLQHNANANGGTPFGFSLLSENWRDGKRQPAGLVYHISKATIFTDAMARRIIVDPSTKVASGIELLDGRVFQAAKEVLVCCGALRTPQLLMLSGIGPASHLSTLSIPLLSDLPVGENLHDHLSATMWWKLKHPERGLAIGSPTFMKPGFEKGNPVDWIVTSSIPEAAKARAASIDKLAPEDPLLSKPRGHVEFFVSYAPIAAPAFFNYNLAGTHISSPVLGLLPTSRGTITLSSTDPTADPIIDPNYLNSEIDKESLRTGVRLALRTMLDTPSGREMIEEETPPPGMPKLNSGSSDEEIDRRVSAVGRSFFQSAGTAAMGKVVDTELKVKGVDKIRVVDASVLPLPLAGHYQYPIYAIAEAAADLILGAA